MAYDDRYPLKDYLNTLNYSKDNLMEDDPGWKKNYPPYVINKCMSHHMDTLMFSNEMNRYPNFCLLYTSPSPRDVEESRMPSSA